MFEILKKAPFMLRNPEDIPVASLSPKECLAPSLLPTHTLRGKKRKKEKQLMPVEVSKVVKFLSQAFNKGYHEVSCLLP